MADVDGVDTPLVSSRRFKDKVLASLGHRDVGQTLRRYPSTPLGERRQWTSVGGRIITGQLQEWWLSHLRDSLDETLEPTVGGVRLRGWSAVDDICGSHYCHAS
jgi:hypothetical protein